MPLIVPAVIAAGSLLGNLFRSRGGQSSTTTRSTQPQFRGLESLLIGRATDRMRNPMGLPEGYETGGINAINSTYEDVFRGIGNINTSGGIQGPMGDARRRNANFARAGQIGQFRAGLPLIEQRLQRENDEFASRLLRGSMGDQTTEFSGGGLGQGLGAGLNDMSSLLAFLYANGSFDQGGGSGTYS
jgi:hypothetical protein